LRLASAQWEGSANTGLGEFYGWLVKLLSWNKFLWNRSQRSGNYVQRTQPV